MRVQETARTTLSVMWDDPEFGPDRPNPFRGATIYAMIGAIVFVFALTLLVVGLTA